MLDLAKLGMGGSPRAFGTSHVELREHSKEKKQPSLGKQTLVASSKVAPKVPTLALWSSYILDLGFDTINFPPEERSWEKGEELRVVKECAME